MSEFTDLVNKYPNFAFNDDPSKRNKNHSLLMIEVYNIMPNNYQTHVMSQYKKCYTWNTKYYNAWKNSPFINIDMMNGFPLFDNYYEPNIKVKDKINGICLICRYRQGSNREGDIVNKRYEVFKSLSIEKKCFGKIPYLGEYYGGKIGNSEHETYPSSIAKLNLLSQWKYSLVFENCYHPIWSWDYVTEKIFDCFLSKCIPIYLGAYNIEQIIPKELFIDYRTFENDNLSLYLKSMSDNKYNKMIEDAQDWMKENRYKRGSIDELEKTVLRLDL